MKGLSRAGGEEAVWHVMNRAAHRVRIFSTDGHLDQFVTLLKTFTKREGLGVAAYCVMPNHYHALVRGAGERLTRCFHEVDRMWAISWNEFREQAGHVFQGPFLSFIQHGAGWVVRTSAYIHLNPVPGIVDWPEKYRWSSYGAYREGAPASSWVDPEIVLRFYREESGKARTSYREFVEARMAWRTEVPKLTEEKAVDWTVARELSAGVAKVGRELMIPEEEARRLVAYHGRRIIGLPISTLAAALGYSKVSLLSNQLSRMRVRLQREPGYQAFVERAEKLLSEL